MNYKKQIPDFSNLMTGASEEKLVKPSFIQEIIPPDSTLRNPVNYSSSERDWNSQSLLENAVDWNAPPSAATSSVSQQVFKPTSPQSPSDTTTGLTGRCDEQIQNIQENHTLPMENDLSLLPATQPILQQAQLSYPPQGIAALPNLTNQYNNIVAQQIKAAVKARRDFNAEEAYNEVIMSSNGLYALDKHQRAHCVFPLVLKKCIAVAMDPIFVTEPFYYIDFEGDARPLIISEKEFKNANVLVFKLESHYKEMVNPCSSKRKVFSAIQSFLSRKATKESFRFYAGWQQGSGQDEWIYSIRMGSTHSVRNFSVDNLDFDIQDSALPDAASVQLTASTQFGEALSSINEASLRHVITSILHLSSLYSLLDGLNYHIPFGICLSCDSRPQLEIIEALCSWFGDSSIILSEPKKRFADFLIERKDQPALVWDEPAQTSNNQMLEYAVKSGIIAIDKKEYKLNSLPIILNQKVTCLSQSPQMIHISIPVGAVNINMRSTIRARKDYFMEYLQYFNRFIQKHQDKLTKAVDNCLSEIEQETAQNDLPQEAMLMLAALHAVDSMVMQYYRSLSPNHDAEKLFATLFTEDYQSLVLESFKVQFCQDSNENIAKLFFKSANQMIAADRFDIREFGGMQTYEPCPQDKAGIIYIHKNEPYFTSEAYDRVVAETGYKSSNIKQALAAVGAFRGAKTNENSYQTRLRGYNPVTGQGATPVYRFSSESIHWPIQTVVPASTDFIKDENESRIHLELGRSVDNSDMVWHGVDNCHVCITGRSGTGKSYFLKKIIAQLPSQNIRCIIFDTSGEFSRSTDCSNPECWKSTEVDVIDMCATQAQKLFFQQLSDADTPDIIASRFSDTLTRRFRFGRKQQSSLVSCIKDAIAKEIHPSFQSLLEQDPDTQVKDVLERLNSFLPLGDTPFNWNFDTPGITVLNFQNGSDDTARDIALELLLSSVCAQQMNVPKENYPPVVLVVDECQLLKWKNGSYAYDIMIRGRKYGLSMWLCTQTLSQIDNPAILEQADLRVFFRPADAELSRITKCLFLSDKREKEQYRGALTQLCRGQFLCKLNNQIYISAPPEKEKT